MDPAGPVQEDEARLPRGGWALKACQSGGLPIEGGNLLGKEGLSLEAPVDWSGLAWHCRLPSFWAEGGRSMTSPPRFLLRRDKEQRGAGGGVVGRSWESC